ncbi:MAG: ABC transporter permease [Mycoplasmataceae bacterium]|nr:ABC transporter permease [Mycoplasmataceae bacterium]
MSVICSIVAVVIFREGRDDGTELIIMSKPIKRIKIILVKFLCFLLIIFTATISAMILALGMFFFGEYDPMKNPNGVVYKDVLNIELGILLGNIVACLFFGSIAILVSVISGKIPIMVTTIGIAIVFNLINMVLPVTIKTPNKYISDQYSISMDSTRYIDVNGNFHDATNAAYVKYFTDDHNDPNVNLNTLYYANQGTKNTFNSFASYLDIGQQMSGLYNAFTETKDTEEHSAFGSKINHRYNINNETVFMNKNKDSWPICYYKLKEEEGLLSTYWTLVGFPLKYLDIYSLTGARVDTIVYSKPLSRDISSLTSAHFYALKDLLVFKDDAAKTQIIEYIHKLENPASADFYGCNVWQTTDQIQFSSKTILEYRNRFLDDLFTNPDSGIYYESPDFPFYYSVKQNDSSYDQALQMNFLLIWYLIMQDCAKGVSIELNNALAAYQNNTSTGLPPFNQWTDKAENQKSISYRLNNSNTFKLSSFSDSSDTLRNWLLGFIASIGGNFPAFSTNPSSKSGDVPYAKNNEVLCTLFNEIYSSDSFSSLYEYSQSYYYDSKSVTIFWSLFAIILLCGAAIVHIRTDIA